MMDKKKLTLTGGIAAAAVVLAAVVVIVLKLNGRTDTYRDISVFELNASANVTRNGTALEAYQGMRLENGDRIQVGDDGYIRLLLDNDKYVTLESGTEICLHATGNSSDSKTEIELVCGAVLNEIDNKLSANSSYELSTPTSVMAVRGTVFRVALTQENEASNVNLIVLDGQVAATRVLNDGTVSAETVLVNAGNALNISKPDGNSDPVCTPAEISYEDLPADTLACILDIYQTGRLEELSIPQEILEQLYEEKNAPQQTDSTVKPDQTETTPETTEAAKPSESSNAQDSTASSSQASTRPDTGNKPSAQGSSTATNNVANTTPAQPAVPDYPDYPDYDDNDDDDPAPQIYYTVTFKDASGNLFGTQYVASGAQAQKPLLSPVGGSNWCDASGNAFDFNSAVTADLTLYYR